ncbi:calcium-binding protein [Methylobacterium sp. 77]|uniref:calcium-binding protein n=1 Tax=Methylobacterium sp. 77 TaxID=1101192 RepID=UPI00047E5BB1|nr:calcium-binding protein [Methylobacterium sp. 77]
MASVSFTYHADYDPGDTVVLDQNALNINSSPSVSITIGPFFMDRFVLNNSGFYQASGAYFTDAQHLDVDLFGPIPKTITGTEYSISADLSDNTGVVYLTGGTFGDVLRAGSNADTVNGGDGNDVLEGGAGADIINGGNGFNTASYDRSASGVTVDLTTGDTTGGDAAGDALTQIQKLVGSAHADSLTGDNLDNTLVGNGGGDALYGMDGHDRLVITDAPAFIDGGTGKDLLFVTGGGTVSLAEAAFTGIETVYVRNDTTLDMSAVETGSKIVSQSTNGHHVEIIGTSGSDRIQAGKGGDTIEGGAGGDKLFAGAGADTFHFETGFGRDNIYNFVAGTDRFDVSALVDSFDQIEFTTLASGTLITFAGAEAGTKIILHDVAASSLHADDFGFLSI